MAKVTEFTVNLENRPGTLADMAEALGKAGVNIDGLQKMPCGGQGIAQLVTNNSMAASQAFESAGIAFTTREVLLLKIEDKPGALGGTARAMAQAGINLDVAYTTISGMLVLGMSDLAGAEKVAREIGAM
jgi:hypothetical protein